MNPKYRHYHNPPPPASTRVRCPVCHEEVYSRAGIHPQCAVRQSDPPKAKNKGQKSPPDVEPLVPVIEPAGADVILELPAAMRIFDPDEIQVDCFRVLDDSSRNEPALRLIP
jgi:hypothetical protein